MVLVWFRFVRVTSGETGREVQGRSRGRKNKTGFYIRWPKALEYQDEGAVVRLFPKEELSAWSADFLFLNPKGLKEHYNYSAQILIVKLEFG